MQMIYLKYSAGLPALRRKEIKREQKAEYVERKIPEKEKIQPV